MKKCDEAKVNYAKATTKEEKRKYAGEAMHRTWELTEICIEVYTCIAPNSRCPYTLRTPPVTGFHIIPPYATSKVFRSLNVPYLVSGCEADVQLAVFTDVDIVISVDSDVFALLHRPLNGHTPPLFLVPGPKFLSTLGEATVYSWAELYKAGLRVEKPTVDTIIQYLIARVVNVNFFLLWMAISGCDWNKDASLGFPGCGFAVFRTALLDQWTQDDFYSLDRFVQSLLKDDKVKKLNLSAGDVLQRLRLPEKYTNEHLVYDLALDKYRRFDKERFQTRNKVCSETAAAASR